MMLSPGEAYDLGKRLFEGGKYKEASACFEWLTAMIPFAPTIWEALACCQHAASQFEKSAVSWEIVRSLAPRSLDAYLHLAENLYSMRQVPQALKVVEEGLSIHDPEILHLHTPSRLKLLQALCEQTLFQEPTCAT